MDNQTIGLLTLLACFTIPFILGVVCTLTIQKRLRMLGWWGLLPMGGLIKRLIEYRKE